MQTRVFDCEHDHRLRLSTSTASLVGRTVAEHHSLRLGRTRRCRAAFSLLELIIVLVVMVGLLAIVWPNLQRPLNRTSLDEAAQTMRVAIDESRYQAMLSGTPWFVRLQVGSPQLTAGTFAALQAESDQQLVSSDLPVAAPATNDTAIGSADDMRDGLANSSVGLRTWQLPERVVVANVHWRLFHAAIAVLDESLTDNVQEEAANDLQSIPYEIGATEMGGPDRDASMELSQAVDAPPQWLPIQASGRGRDATIVLWDRMTQQSIQVVYVSATGAVEVVR